MQSNTDGKNTLDNGHLQVIVTTEIARGKGSATVFHQPSITNVDGSPIDLESVEKSGFVPQIMAIICSGWEVTDPRLKTSCTFSLVPDQAVLRVEDTVENMSSEEVEFLWGESLLIGGATFFENNAINASASSYFDQKEEPILRMRWPFLADGTDISKPVAGTPNETSEYFLCDFAEGKCTIESASKKYAVELRWDATVFPYCWMNRNDQGVNLSPHSGLPTAIEEGHGLVSIPPKGKITTWFELEVITLPEPRA